MKTEWLQTLKVGDEVAVVNPINYQSREPREVTFGHVESFGKTVVVVGGRKYRRRDGRQTSPNARDPSCDYVLIKLASQYRDEVERNRCWDLTYAALTRGIYGRLTTDQLQRIAAIIEEPKANTEV